MSMVCIEITYFDTMNKLIRSISIVTLLLLAGCDNSNDKPAEAQQVEIEAAKETTKSTDMETKSDKATILFYGDSLTAGYGLSEEESFPSLVQRRIDSLGLDYQVVNAGLSGETTSGGVSRIEWVLQQPVDIFVLELGANDMLRGLDISATRDNLEKIINTVNTQYPDAELIIAGMQSPPNMGPEYTSQFNSLFGELSQKYDAGFIPFLLDGVAGIESLNLPDGKHPNATGQKIVVENVWKVLKDYL